MSDFSHASARTTIDVAEASEIARHARQNDPNVLARHDVQALLGHSALVLDGLRRRPRYFDGRFLTGADLTRDQDYIRQRQADLARAGGVGVVTGLRIGLTGLASGQHLTISPGHGVTPQGDLVLVASSRSIAPLDIPSVERLDASLGLRREARLPLGRRTGLFILALRPVEFTANPIAAYPTSITGQRQIEDGDVIEASAITLIPYPNTDGAATLDEARRTVARALFLHEPHGIPQNALPLAMIAMDRGGIHWIDEAMVRRETGADTPLQVALGASPRARAEAFVVQHRRHLRDVLNDRKVGGLPNAFAAAQYFAALPAAGQLPAASILTDPLGFRQLWFPPAVNVDLSFVPSDEIAALVDESLALPAIDLLGDPEDLDATGILILAPVTRQRLQRFEQALTALTTKTVADPAQGIRRAPANLLAAMLARRAKFAEASVRDAEANARAAAADAETKAWQAAWAEAVAAIPVREGGVPLLWYVRRRAVATRAQVTGVAVAVAGDDERLVQEVRKELTLLGETLRLNALLASSTPFAAARMLAFLGAPRIAKSDLLVRAALHDLELAAVPTEVAPAPPLEGSPLPADTAVPAIERSATKTGVSKKLVESPPIFAPKEESVAAAGVGAPQGLAAIRPGFARLIAARAVVGTGQRPTGPSLIEAEVIDIASDYGDPRLGDGLARVIAAANPAFGEDDRKWLSSSGHVLSLDRAGREVDFADFALFIKDLGHAVTSRDGLALARVVGDSGEV